MNYEKLINIGKVALLVLVFLIGFYFTATMEVTERNYEVHGADGTVYHTSNISHGSGRIWFRDANGNRVELGGGYTVIEK